MAEDKKTLEYIFDAKDIREDGVYERHYTINCQPCATLVLRPGEGEFVIVEDNIPFKITSGLSQLCAQLHQTLLDFEYHELKATTILLQDLHGMSELFSEGKFPSPEHDERYIAALTYLDRTPFQWAKYSQKERCAIIVDTLNRLRTDMREQPFVRITGTGLSTLSDILHDDEPVFTFSKETYQTQDPSCLTLHEDLRNLGTLLAANQLK